MPEQSSAAGPAPGGGAGVAQGGLFGRRRKQAEAAAENLAGELARSEERARTLAAQVTQLTDQLARVIGADSATIAAEQERLRQAHEEKQAELQRIDGLLDAKVEHAAERAARSLVDVRDQAHALGQQAEQAQRQVAAAQADLVVIDEVRMLQEAGIYEYRHPLADAVAYAGRLEEIKTRYKRLARENGAVLAAQDWTVNGSLAQGRKMVRDFSKLMLRAYNAEADNAVRGMRPHRLSSLIDRLGKTRETIARLGATMHIRISDEYHRLRVQELELTADHLARKEAEKEAQRELRAAQREEERLQREIERERQRLEKERGHYESALRRLRAGTGDAAGIAELEGRLAQLDDDLRAVEAREANIRAGYVYVISNIGAFGERMVKIGLTRRLDPMDRVNELGDASVPFRFDVHALIFSEDAVGLERRLHQEFEDRRVNRVNTRREFFYTTPAEVRTALRRLAGQHLLEFTETAEAPEWRASRTPAQHGHGPVR
ncbi:DUF4041 domain-containing protein [Streptomyces sp. CRN 30]|uniref:DUF4041 domain-containing protein n=1 Tax=Streptomyces sp. CRN 30 TaxID=3075613 RepID=UPI002A7FCE8B|nr:DUF4041 domain-containing protein [Streptomyces sp. CRN 30]